MKVFGRIFVFLLALVVAYALLVISVRLLPVPEDQRAAIARLSAPVPPVRGRDASNVMLVQDRDIPADQRERVGRALRAHYARDGFPPMPADGPGQPLADYPALPDAPEDGKGTCDGAQPGCLAYVRADAERVRQVLAAQVHGLDTALALARYDGTRFGFDRQYLGTYIPPLGKQRALVPTHFALQFADGQRAAALGGLCDDIAGWRRLGANNDSLIMTLIATGFVQRDVQVLGDLLAELPRTEALPAACTAALRAPTNAEFDLCPAMHTELEFWPLQLRMGVDASDWTRVTLLDERDMIGRFAVVVAASCGADARRAMREDRPVRDWVPRDLGQCKTFAKVVDPMGCILVAIDAPSRSVRYADRRMDMAAMLGLARAIEALRTHSSGENEKAAHLRNYALQAGLRRTPLVSVNGRLASIPLYARQPGARFSLPLPEATPPAK